MNEPYLLMLGAGLADTDRGLERADAVGGFYSRGLNKQWIDCRRRYSARTAGAWCCQSVPIQAACQW